MGEKNHWSIESPSEESKDNFVERKEHEGYLIPVDGNDFQLLFSWDKFIPALEVEQFIGQNQSRVGCFPFKLFIQ